MTLSCPILSCHVRYFLRVPVKITVQVLAAGCQLSYHKFYGYFLQRNKILLDFIIRISVKAIRFVLLKICTWLVLKPHGDAQAMRAAVRDMYSGD